MKTWTSIGLENRGKIENWGAYLTDRDLSCLGKVVYHSENNTVARIQWPQWRKCATWEQSGVYWFVLSTFAMLFWDGRGVVVGQGEARGWKCKGSDKCLHLCELTLNHSHRNQVSWRTGSWVKERLLRSYFWLLLWMLLWLVYLYMYHNHGDHVFSSITQVKVVNFNIYLGKYGHHSYEWQRRMILRWAVHGIANN